MLVFLRWVVIEMALRRVLSHHRVQRLAANHGLQPYPRSARNLDSRARYGGVRPLRSCAAMGCVGAVLTFLLFIWLVQAMV